MSAAFTHHELEELIGAYVVDAVEPDERAAIEEHLNECPRCRAEVGELREVVAVLGNAGSPAPEGVWDRITASLEETPPPLRLVLPARGPESMATTAPAPAPAPAPARHRSPMRWVAMGAVAALIAVVVGAAGWTLRGESNRTTPVAQLELAANQALAEPGSRLAVLRTSDLSSTAKAVAVVRADGEGYLVGHNLPPLDDRIYQLWGQSPDGIVSLGVMSHPGVVGFTVDPTISTLMVSEEDHQVDQPQHPAVLTGELS